MGHTGEESWKTHSGHASGISGIGAGPGNLLVHPDPFAAQFSVFLQVDQFT